MTRRCASWDGEPDPRVVGMCGSDSHGRIGDNELMLTTWLLVLDAPVPQGAARERAAALLDHLDRGRFHCVAGLFARDPVFAFAAWRGEHLVAAPGDEAAVDEVQDLVVEGPTASAPVSLLLLRNGQPVARTQGNRLRYSEPSAGTYRVEVQLAVPGVLVGSSSVPVIYSNRIRLVTTASAGGAEAVRWTRAVLGWLFALVLLVWRLTCRCSFRSRSAPRAAQHQTAVSLRAAARAPDGGRARQRRAYGGHGLPLGRR